MKLAPGTPLAISLAFDATQPEQPAGRLAMAGGLAQLEWSAPVIQAARKISPVYYPPGAGLLAARSRAFEGLHGFLADSLPEGWGRLLLRRRLAKLNVRIDALNALDHLALVGDQGRGALVFEPNTASARSEESALDLDALAVESAAVLEGEESGLADTLADLAVGSGGARPKIHVGFDGEGRFSAGTGETAPKQESWIVKFRAQADPIDIGPIEAAYAAMAKKAGLNVSAHHLIPAKKGPGYFATRRFDRPAPGRRLHVVSLCGAIEAPSSIPSSYDQFLLATQLITRHAEDLAAVFRRMVFNVLAHNRDDHTKQHSYLMNVAGDWRLAPAYDLTYSAGPGGEHYLDIEGEGRAPTAGHVAAVGRRHGFRDREIAATIDEVRAAVTDWPRFAKEAGVTDTSRRSITSAHDAVWGTFGKLR